MKLRTALFGVVLVGLGGCASEPAPGGGNLPTSNPEVSVDVLLEVDGYRVYRFHDAGYPRYFVTPTGAVIGSHTQSCGKNCTRTVADEIRTLP